MVTVDGIVFDAGRLPALEQVTLELPLHQMGPRDRLEIESDGRTAIVYDPPRFCFAFRRINGVMVRLGENGEPLSSLPTQGLDTTEV